MNEAHLGKRIYLDVPQLHFDFDIISFLVPAFRGVCDMIIKTLPWSVNKDDQRKGNSR